MKNAVQLAIATLVLAASSFAGVTISSPAPGSSSGSPVHFVASASSSLPIVAMRIYVDDVSVFANSSNQLDTLVTMNPGTHTVVVQAWDSSGAVFKTPETVTVSAGGGGTGSSNVSVNSPANGATVGSPIHVVASASASAPIASMQIYMDDNLVFTGNGASLDTQVSAGSGSHSLVIKAWDNNGTPYTQSLTVNVSGTSTPPPPSGNSNVSVSSPANGATVGSPIHVVASSSASAGTSAMQIYMDSNLVFTGNGANLDTQVAAGSGSHALVIKAWDNNGTPYAQSLTVNVSGTSTPPPPSGNSNVSVSSPANGATVGSPIHVVASSSASHPIAAMQIYLDNNLVFTNNSSSLDTQIAASGGAHSMVVKAWDNTGTPYAQSLTVNVNGGSAPPPSSIPASATVVNEVQQMGGWESCTVCAGIDGSGPSANFSMVQGQSSPSLSGSSTKFSISGSTPWAAALWWKQLTPNNNASNFVYDADFYIDNGNFTQGLEFDVNQSIGNLKFIFGTECTPNADWDVWDTANAHWVQTGVPCAPPASFTWHHVTWEFQRNATQTIFVALTYDGVKHYINMVFNAKPVSASELNVAFQLDGDAVMHAYTTWLDNLSLASW